MTVTSPESVPMHLKLASECVNSGLAPHQQQGHTEMGPRFKVSSERPEKRGIDLAIPGLVV